MNCNHPNCKHHKGCNLKTPMTKYTKEINYLLNELKKAKWRLEEYRIILKDIQQYHTYSIPVNVYGHIKYAPKKNAFGVFIRKPEHVYYGWNLSMLNNKLKELVDKVKELRLKELRDE